MKNAFKKLWFWFVLGLSLGVFPQANWAFALRFDQPVKPLHMTLRPSEKKSKHDRH